MKELHELKMKLMEELKDQARKIGKRGEMNGGDLDTLAKLTKTIDRLCEIMEKDEGGHSQAGMWEADMRGEYGPDGYSGRRNAMGRFTSRDGNSMDGYSGNSYGMDVMKELEEMARRVDDRQRDVIRRAMRELRG